MVDLETQVTTFWSNKRDNLTVPGHMPFPGGSVNFYFTSSTDTRGSCLEPYEIAGCVTSPLLTLRGRMKQMLLL